MENTIVLRLPREKVPVCFHKQILLKERLYAFLRTVFTGGPNFSIPNVTINDKTSMFVIIHLNIPLVSNHKCYSL